MQVGEGQNDGDGKAVSPKWVGGEASLFSCTIKAQFSDFLDHRQKIG